MGIPRDWISTGEASRRLGMAPNNVRRLIDLGRLRAERTPLGFLIDPKTVEAYRREKEARETRRKQPKPDDDPANLATAVAAT